MHTGAYSRKVQSPADCVEMLSVLLLQYKDDALTDDNDTRRALGRCGTLMSLIRC